MEYIEGKVYDLSPFVSLVAVKSPEDGSLIYNIFEKEDEEEVCVIANGKSLEEAFRKALSYFSVYRNKYEKVARFVESLERPNKIERELEDQCIHVSKEYAIKEMEVPEDQYKEFGPYKWSSLFRDKKRGKWELMTDLMIIRNVDDKL